MNEFNYFVLEWSETILRTIIMVFGVVFLVKILLYPFWFFINKVLYKRVKASYMFLNFLKHREEFIDFMKEKEQKQEKHKKEMRDKLSKKKVTVQLDGKDIMES